MMHLRNVLRPTPPVVVNSLDSLEAQQAKTSDAKVSAVVEADAEPREFTMAYVRRHLPVILYTIASAIVLITLIYFSFFAARMEDGTVPEFTGCRWWSFAGGSTCGPWGIDCRPFETDEWSAIRCPRGCLLDQSSSLAVYGSGPYRGDSRICRAAIHAGVIGANGGCALIRYSGQALAFYGSDANGVSSRDYMSWFPKTFEFKAASSVHCSDFSWTILALSVIIFFAYALFPHTSAAKLYYLLMGWGFVYVRLVGHPSSLDYTDMTITAFGEIAVLLAASHFIYSLAPQHTFRDWKDTTLRWRIVKWGCCYVLPYHLLLNMSLFDNLPWLNIELGGTRDNSDVGAGTYIFFTIFGLFALGVACWLARKIYRAGLAKHFVCYYLLLWTFVFISWGLFSSSTTFHLHHVMLGAILIPMTRFPESLAVIVQAALLGAFVQGYAAWGWSTYLDTIPSYSSMDYPDNSPVVVNVTNDSVSMYWEPLEEVDGYAVTLNKVQVYRGISTNVTISGLLPNMTYFVRHCGIVQGSEGADGPIGNFTTAP